MSIPFELITPDSDSSFRTIHLKVTQDAFKWDYHFHPEIEIVFVKNGNGRRHVGNHIAYYEDGDLVIIGSNLPHSGFGFGASGIHEETVIQFKNDFLGKNFWDAVEFSEIKKLIERSEAGISFGEKSKKEASVLLEEFYNKPPIVKLKILIELLATLSMAKDYSILNEEYSTTEFNFKNQTRLNKLFQFVETHYFEPISTQDAAEITNLTTPAFCNYFKKVTNSTFTEFVNNYRIKQACKMLRDGMSVSDSCFEAGFNSLAYFSRTFKVYIGLTPTEYKRNAVQFL